MDRGRSGDWIDSLTSSYPLSRRRVGRSIRDTGRGPRDNLLVRRKRDELWVRADAFLAGMGNLEWSTPLAQLMSGRRQRHAEQARRDFSLEGQPIPDRDGQDLCRRYGLRADAGRVVRMIAAPH